eukprot:TRINITY_DN8681_c0_g1_i2.p1 TRINITY_DN8681_c0_g1~~TRINITY_DN8681_c0_g1_i2.p1  ORF type:complete len:272 (-),score=44.21 TRINITY_DN8681_c0_g1_i2:77-892(-)
MNENCLSKQKILLSQCKLNNLEQGFENSIFISETGKKLQTKQNMIEVNTKHNSSQQALLNQKKSYTEERRKKQIKKVIKIQKSKIYHEIKLKKQQDYLENNLNILKIKAKTKLHQATYLQQLQQKQMNVKNTSSSRINKNNSPILGKKFINFVKQDQKLYNPVIKPICSQLFISKQTESKSLTKSQLDPMNISGNTNNCISHKTRITLSVDNISERSQMHRQPRQYQVQLPSQQFPQIELRGNNKEQRKQKLSSTFYMKQSNNYLVLKKSQ